MTLGANGGERGSLVGHAVEAVRSHISDNDLKVGDSLPGEGHFAKTLGVSRAVIREAFGSLAALKVIDVANGRRAKVAPMDGSVMASSIDHAVATDQISVTEIWDVRRTVEQRIAVLAAERRSEAEANEILRLAILMRETSHDLPRMTQYDIAFHQAIATAANNPLFTQIVRSFATLMTTAVPRAWQTRRASEERELMLDRHLVLAKAIVAGDPVAAGDAMKAHFDDSVGDLLKAETA